MSSKAKGRCSRFSIRRWLCCLGVMHGEAATTADSGAIAREKLWQIFTADSDCSPTARRRSGSHQLVLVLAAGILSIKSGKLTQILT